MTKLIGEGKSKDCTNDTDDCTFDTDFDYETQIEIQRQSKRSGFS